MWLDETDEDDEYMFNDDEGMTPVPVSRFRARAERARGTRTARRLGNFAKGAAMGFKRLTGRAARTLVGVLSDR